MEFFWKSLKAFELLLKFWNIMIENCQLYEVAQKQAQLEFQSAFYCSMTEY